MRRRVPWLEELPTVRIDPSRPGAYRLRREPSAECLSTVEAVVEALAGLEPETPRLGELLGVFERMIDRQIPFVRAGARPRFRARPRRTPKVPEQLRDDENLVLVGSEYAGQERVYRWVAHRLATGETLDCWLSPPPNEDQLRHMGVGAITPVSAEEARESWNQFARPGDVRIGWNERVLHTCPGEGGVALKRIYCSLRPGRPGHLSALVEQLALSVPAPAVPGRVGTRLAELRAVLHWLRDSG
jgi:hypothetical protein